MNSIIKKTIVILVLIVSNINIIYSNDLVITIPEQFNRFDYPLPPFPSEVINSLDTSEYTNSLENEIEFREILLQEINYLEFQTILDFNISSSFISDYGLRFVTDLKGISPSILYSLESNLFSIKSEIGYEYSSSLPFINSNFRSYTLPIYNMIELDTVRNNYLVTAGINQYSNKALFTTGYSSDSFLFNIKFNNFKGIYPSINYNYTTSPSFYGHLGLSIGRNIFGFYNVDTTIYPYIKALFSTYDFTFNIDTNKGSEEITYKVIGSKDSYNRLKLGVGLDLSNSYNKFDPFILIEESILPGKRLYYFNLNSYSISYNFIKNNYTNIINCSISDFNKISISYELENELLKVCNVIDFTIDKSEFSYNLNLTIWAGN